MRDGNSKIGVRFFSITQWKQEEEYLRKQHQDGWKFTRVGFPGIYHFEKCEPEDVVYQLDYNQEGVAHKQEYIQMFYDCGWEYLQDFFGYSYFRKPVSQMHGEEEIFCDDFSRFDMMKRVLRGRMLPLVVMFFCIIIPQVFMQSHFDYGGWHGLWYVFLVLFGVYLVLFAHFAYQFWQYWKRIYK